LYNSKVCKVKVGSTTLDKEKGRVVALFVQLWNFSSGMKLINKLYWLLLLNLAVANK